MIPKPFSEDFIAGQPLATWQEVSVGLEMGLIGWRSAVRFAVSRLEPEPEPTTALIELAGLTKDLAWKASELANVLANSERIKSKEEIKSKWLFIVLRWLYENMNSVQDPFREVEIVYADFEYPAEIEGFVGFMPPSDGWRPQDHSPKENRERMIRLWRSYLENKQALYLREP